MKLKNKILIFGIFLYIVFSFLFYLYYLNVKTILVENVEREITTNTKIITEYIDNLINISISTLMLLSSMDAVKRGDYEKMKELLNEYKKKFNFYNLYFIDENGIVRVASSKNNEILRNITKNGIKIVDKKYIISLSVPVYNDSKQIGTLIGDILLKGDELENLLSNLRYCYAEIRYNDIVIAKNQRVIRGEERVRNRFIINEKLNLTLITEHNLNELNSLISIRNQYILFTIIYLVIFLFIFIYINKDIIRPIENLSRHMKTLAEGTYGIKIEDKTKTKEIDSLVKSFNILSTKLKEYLLETLKAYKRIKEIIEKLDVAIAITDADGNIVIKNKAFKNIFGDINRVTEYKGEVKNKRLEMLLKGYHENIIKIKNRYYKYIIKQLSENFLLESFIDITKEIEEKIRLIELESIKKKIIYSISHEIKTPLTVILLASNVLKDRIENDISLNILVKIVKNAIKIKDVTEKVLNYYLVEKTQYPEFDTVYLKELINEVIKDMSEKLDERNINLIVNIPSEHKVFACRFLLKLALKELIDNAIKFNKYGGTIEIKSREVGNFIRVSIKDTGIGLSRDEMKIVLQPFIQISEFYKGKPRGLGLGLTIVKKVLELHNSKLYVKGEKGKGTEFYFYLEKASKSSRN